MDFPENNPNILKIKGLPKSPRLEAAPSFDDSCYLQSRQLCEGPNAPEKSDGSEPLGSSDETTAPTTLFSKKRRSPLRASHFRQIAIIARA
jgi:hypothetical protein